MQSTAASRSSIRSNASVRAINQPEPPPEFRTVLRFEEATSKNRSMIAMRTADGTLWFGHDDDRIKPFVPVKQTSLAETVRAYRRTFEQDQEFEVGPGIVQWLEAIEVALLRGETAVSRG